MMEGKHLSLMTFNFSQDYHKKTMTVQDSLMLAACETLREFIVHVHLKDVALAKPKFSLLPDERTADGWLMKGTVFGQGDL